MKTIHIALLGLVLSAGLVSGAQAHEPRVGFSVQLGYPGYVPPPVYYAPPPPVVYLPPPPMVYGPVPVYGPRYVNPGYYGYDRGYRHGWRRHGRHRHWEDRD
ncbi:MAG: hypothetical protein H6R15_1996 [Proteobacteria bacterium]|nr:hypothetical protein [Pseudomonadota bacterium]